MSEPKPYSKDEYIKHLEQQVNGLTDVVIELRKGLVEYADEDNWGIYSKGKVRYLYIPSGDGWYWAKKILQKAEKKIAKLGG